MDIIQAGWEAARKQELQWGHALSGMDIRLKVFPLRNVDRLQWGHALSGMDILYAGL